MRLSSIVLTSLLLACGCAGKVQDPIPTQLHSLSAAEPSSPADAVEQPAVAEVETEQAASESARVLLVALPGAGDRVGTYDKHGLVESLRETGMSVDMLEVDAHTGYYFGERTLLQRMEEDVLAPNRERYDEIWVVGISMGGIGALLTAWTYPEDIDGLVLMSPYLGRRKTLRQISEAGGIAAWQPPEQAEDEAWDIEIWRMLKQATEGDKELELYLMYGDKDLGVRAHHMLAEALPAERVKVTPGGHAWSTWSTLWTELMADRPFEG